MFVQVEALFEHKGDVDYKGMGITPPEELMEFKPMWVNLQTVSTFWSAKDPGEIFLALPNRTIQINMSEDNFLMLLDEAGMIPDLKHRV